MLNRKSNFLEKIQETNKVMRSAPLRYRFLNDPFSKLEYSAKKNITLSPAMPKKKLIRYELNFLQDRIEKQPSKILADDKWRLQIKKAVSNPSIFLKKHSSEPLIDSKRRVSFNFIHTYPKRILDQKDTSEVRGSTPSFREETSVNDISFGRKECSMLF